MRRVFAKSPGVAGGTGAPAARSMWRLLLDPTVGSYTLARQVSAMGIWIHNIVAAVVVYDVTGSAFIVGTVSIAQFGPQILLSPYMGARADRGDRQRQAAVGHFISALGSGGLALWIWIIDSGVVTSALPVILGALVMGIGFTMGAPAAHALLPSLGRPSELGSLVALATAPMTLGRAIGPGLGALLLVTSGPAVAFAITSGSMVFFSVVVTAIRPHQVERRKSGDKSVLGGLRYLRQDIGVVMLLLAVTGLGFGVDPLITLSPAIAEGFGGGTNLVAQLTAAFGIGSAVFLVFQGIIRRALGESRVASLGLGVMCISMVALGFSPAVEAAIGASFIAGLGMMGAMTSLSTQIQSRVPEEFRGRIMALWTVAFLGSRPLAAAVNGAIADAWSPTLALIVVSVILVGAALLSVASASRI
jgi:MFS family permease